MRGVGLRMGIGGIIVGLVGLLAASFVRAMPPDPGLLRRILNGEDAYEGLPAGAGPAERDRADTNPELVADDPGASEAPDALGTSPAVARAAPADDDRSAASAAEGAPGDSLSLGYTAYGSLVRAASFPAAGEGLALLPFVQERGTQYATDEMVGLVQRAAARLHERYPGATVRVGNASFRRGGKIPWSVSHRAGRDADIAFFVRDRKGRPLGVQDYDTFDKKGRASGAAGRLFDVERNWTLVETLLLDPEVRVQRIFVAAWLREKLLDYARSSGAPSQAILRAELVLAQPTDSAPHADHFHVRIYCSLDDRLEGCHDFGPVWPWVDSYDEEVAHRIASLVQDLRKGAARQKIAALDLLRQLEAHDRADAVGRLLADADDRVRHAALRCLRSLRSPDRAKSIAAALKKTTSPHWAQELLGALEAEGPTGHVALLERIVKDVGKALPALTGSDTDTAQVRALAAEALGKSGRQASVRPLIDRLVDESPTVRAAAATALPFLTNHDFGGRWKTGTPAKRLLEQQAKWERWYRKSLKQTHAQWIRDGFEKRGIRFRGKMVSRRSIPTLLKTLRRGAYQAHNARRILVQLVGAAPAARCGTDPACWEKWWRKHHREFGHKTAGL